MTYVVSEQKNNNINMMTTYVALLPSMVSFGPVVCIEKIEMWKVHTQSWMLCLI